MRRSWSLAAVGLLAVAAVPIHARAGQAPEPPKLTVGVAAGRGQSALHDDASGLTWEAAVRIRLQRYFGIEVAAGQLRTEVARSVFDRTVQIGGVTGHVERFDMTTERATGWGVFNALAMVTAGRVTIAGGGGVGISAFGRTFTQQGVGCDPGVESACAPLVIPFSSSGFRFQSLGDIDVMLSRNLTAFGQVRFAVQGGYTETAVVAGARLGFREP